MARSHVANSMCDAWSGYFSNSEFKWNDSCFQVERFLLHGKELSFRLRPGQSREKLKVSVSMVSVTRINDMQDEMFADAIGEINVTSSVVRLDFVSLSPTERDENNNPKAVFRQRIVMPIGALGNAADLISRVMDNLVKSGAIRYEPATTQLNSPTEAWHKRSLDTNSASEAPTKQTTLGVPSSPNFSLVR